MTHLEHTSIPFHDQLLYILVIVGPLKNLGNFGNIRKNTENKIYKLLVSTVNQATDTTNIQEKPRIPKRGSRSSFWEGK